MILVKTVLIVDDEPRIRHLISYYLEQEGFKTIEAENGKEALEIFMRKSIDLVILDLMMPVMDGIECCKELRKTSTVMILMLTAKAEENDKLLGYELGTDDYVTKPFSPKVIVAKVKAMLRRMELPLDENEEVISIEGLEINERSHDIIIEGNSIDFSPKEFDILSLLVRNRGHVLTRDTILNKVWGDDYYGDFRTVDTHIRRIREKLKDYAGAIVTVTGVGYKFEVRK
jgi:two-component system, OmpR family, response regulator ResD